jgi:long-chain acyl-CoA synthetase
MARWRWGAALALAFWCAGTQALEVAGVAVADTVKLGGADLVLNGAGVRTRAIFKVYVGALYVAERRSAASDILGQRGPKRVALHLLRDLSAEQLGGALADGLAANLSPAEQARFKAQIDELKAVMEAVGAAREKSVVTLDFLPDSGLRIAVDGTARGKPIAGDEFYRALLKIWIGDQPVDRSLKAAMLGQPS